MYRSERLPALRAHYLFADNYSGVISAIDIREDEPERLQVARVARLVEAGISSLSVDRAGRVLITVMGSVGRDDGSVLELVPAAEAQQQLADVPAPASGPQAFADLCANCHGPDGGASADTAAQGLGPRPRDLRDPSWQASVTDDEIAQVIREGGTARGLSPAMPAWSSVLSESEIREMVQVIRGFASANPGQTGG